MFKGYIINQLTQISAWLGFAVIVSALFLPLSITVALGFSMIFIPDAKFQKMFAEWSPWVKKNLEGL